MIAKLLRYLLRHFDKPEQWDYPVITLEEAKRMTGYSAMIPMDQLRPSAVEVMGGMPASRQGKTAAGIQRALVKANNDAEREQSKPRDISWEDLLKRRWTRAEVIEIARIAKVILPTGQYMPPEPEPESKALTTTHRGRVYQADPYNKELAKPRELNAIVEELRRMGIPFLMVCHKTSEYPGVHGWCNGANWGRDVLEELARCAELNFRQEMEKCAGQNRTYQGEKRYSGRIPGEFLDGSDPGMKRLR